jgi:hypothetical protein
MDCCGKPTSRRTRAQTLPPQRLYTLVGAHMVVHACGRVGHGLPLGATDCESGAAKY